MASGDPQDEKKYYKDNLFTRETFGVILGVFSLVILFVLFSRGAILGSAGEAISSFVLGAIGFAAYPAFIYAALSSIKIIFGIKTPVTGKERALFSVALLLIFLIAHTATVSSSAYSFDTFGGYVSACFKAPSSGGITALGVLGAVLTYPVIAFAYTAGEYILCSVLLAVTVYAVGRHYYTKKTGGKPSLAERRQEKLAQKKQNDKITVDKSRPYPVNVDFNALRTEAAREGAYSDGNGGGESGAAYSGGSSYYDNSSSAPSYDDSGYTMGADGSYYSGGSYSGRSDGYDDSGFSYSADGGMYYNPYADNRARNYDAPSDDNRSYSYDVRGMSSDERRRLVYDVNPVDYRVNNLIYNKDSKFNNRKSSRKSNDKNSVFEDFRASNPSDTKMYKDGSYVYKEEPAVSDKTYIESYEQQKDEEADRFTPRPRIFETPARKDGDESGSSFGGRDGFSDRFGDGERNSFDGGRRFGNRAEDTPFGETPRRDTPFGENSRRDTPFGENSRRDTPFGENPKRENSFDNIGETPRETLRDFSDETSPADATDDNSLGGFFRAERGRGNSTSFSENISEDKTDGVGSSEENEHIRSARGENGEERRFGRISKGSEDDADRASRRQSLLGGASSTGGYFSSSLDLGDSSSRRRGGLTPTDEPSPFDGVEGRDLSKGEDGKEFKSDRISGRDELFGGDDYGDKSRFLDDDVPENADVTPPSRSDVSSRGSSSGDAGYARGMGIFGKNGYSSDGKEDKNDVQNSRVSEYKREPPKPITPPHDMNPVPVSNYPPKQPTAYKAPPLDLFRQYNEVVDVGNDEVNHNKEIIIKVLAAYKIQAQISAVTKGPAFTRYDITVPLDVTAKRVASCATQIAMNLHAKDGVNIYANLGNGTNSIEVPNKKRGLVGLAPLLADKAFTSAKPEDLTFAIGRDVEGKNIYGRIAKMTHLLVAGATGAGKSVFLNTLLLSLITHYTPWQLRLILIDPKKIEFTIYNHLPHLMMDEIITEASKAVATLNWAIDEMERRYMLFDQMTKSGKLVRNIDEYNQAVKDKTEKIPKIVIVVDELADLMSIAKKDIEDRISRLAAKSRACGIHLVLATQRPSVDVITGVIKSNLPTRFAFKVAAEVDSRTILDEQGAEKLLGYGDMLYKTAQSFSPVRVQGALVESDEVQRVVEWIKANNDCYYDPAILDTINKKMSEGSEGETSDDDPEAPIKIEPVYINALEYVIMQKSASISMLQRKFSIGYNKAGRIIEWMESMNYISAFDGAKSRSVSITMDEFIRKYRSDDASGGYGE